MNVRGLLAAALVAASVMQSNAAIGESPFVLDPPEVVNFPRPMPGPGARLDEFWQTIREWFQPKLGHKFTTEKLI